MNWTERRRREARRRRAVRVAAALGCSVGLLCLTGLLLPAEQGVSGQVLLDRAPETIWLVLTDFDGMPLWRSDLTALERLPDLAGRPAWREIGRAGVRIVELAAAEPPSRLVFRRANGSSQPPSTTFVLRATGRRTLVTVTQRALVRNPLRRVLNWVYPPRAALTRFLRDLDQRVNGRRPQIAGTPG